ncbi:agarase [Persicitalea jodogahamensis]|uniref:Agarase n=1 Tax=Persicitalea jodogahamensis TaxID=402147 RepID=A0A8J3D4P2_9BACT|nr:agarase [Persicitalea jodogahamensis]GHB74978.1 hypothetical protein GCM10007390_30850 [Persicitalea jodogahamensis]
MKSLKNKVLTIISTWVLSVPVFAQNVQVEVNPDIKRSVGGIETFDRQKFITIHSDITDREWDGDNEPGDLRKNFLEKYDVYLGRNTGGITYWLNSEITEDPQRPGYANPADITKFGSYVKSQYAAKPAYLPYEKRNRDQVICAQLHPFWPDGQKTKKGWAFSQIITAPEPFGTATGTYMAEYIKQFYGNGGASGEHRPKYIEVINEPLWHLVDYGKEEPRRIFEFHNSVTDAIRKQLPEIPIGGYCAAFPDLDKNNFREWEERMKLFMDMSGEKMDFWSIHLYDFPAFSKKQLYRKGSNMEATLDMMEQYSFMKFGKAKPFLVSEYGAQMHDYSKQWSPYRDWLFLKSANSMLMQFMERPNLISKAIPFVIVKAEWGRAADGTPYNQRLMRQAKEVAGQSGDQYVYTDYVKLYQLWSDVKGTRVDAKSNHLDILTDSYVDGNTLYVILNNLKFQAVKVDLKLPKLENNAIKDVETRHLYLKGQEPSLEIQKIGTPPATVELGAEATMILAYTLNTPQPTDHLSLETKYYADTYYQPINPSQKNTFNFNNVKVDPNHEAVLRVGVGRSHGLSLKPTVLFNGTPLQVPDDFRGDEQKDRANFFGVLEIQVPAQLLRSGLNTVEVTFPDGGGRISSACMQVFNFTREVRRFAGTILSTEPDSPRVGLTVSPNPSAGKVVIRLDHFKSPTDLFLSALNGEKLLSRQGIVKETVLDLSFLPTGTYILTAGSGNEWTSKRIALE